MNSEPPEMETSAPASQPGGRTNSPDRNVTPSRRQGDEKGGLDSSRPGKDSAPNPAKTGDSPAAPNVPHPTGSSVDAARPEIAADEGLREQASLGTTVSRVLTATKEPSFSLLHETLFVSVISLAQFLTQAGLAQAIAPLHVLGHSFNTTNPGQLSWLPAAYSLTVGTFILPAGRWGDLFGHKRLFVFGYFWFSLWSLIAGFSVFSRSLVFFAFCRAMQGIGPALLLPNGIAILSRIYPPGPRKAMVLSIFGATAPGGFVVGAVFSGIFTRFLWWPWAYWVMSMALALVGVTAIFVIPDMPVIGGKATIEELDAPGTIIGMVGLILFNFAWNQGPAAGWDKVYVYVLLIVGVFFLVLFFWFEKKRATFPLVPISSFSTSTKLVFGCEALGWASFGIWVFYLWQFLEVERGQSILLSAAQIIPTAVSGCIAAITTGFLITRIQPGWIMLISMTAFLVGNILLARAPVKQTYWAQTFVSTVVTCWGMDMSFPSGVIVLSNSMPPEHQGLAASMINTIVNYSISIGLGMAGTVQVHVNSGGRNLLQGFRGAWYLGIGFDGLGILFAICLLISWRAKLKAEAKAKNREKEEVSSE